MGQKVNPHGLRVGVIKDWDSRWYARNEKVGDLLVEDKKIRDYLKKTLYSAGIPKIEIERDNAKVRIYLHCARPGVVIGKGGEAIEALRLKLEKMLGKSVALNIVEVKSPDMNAQLVAENIAQQLEKRIGFRRAMKNAMGRAMRMGALGIKTQVSGRLGGAEIARTEHYHDGTIPLQTLRADIDYGFAEAATTYGRIGVKVWIYKGEVLTQTLRTTPRTLDTSKPYQERRERPRQEPRRRPAARPREHASPVMLAGVAVLLMMAVVLMMGYIRLMQASHDVTVKQAQLQQAQEDNVALGVAYEKAFDQSAVKAAAQAAGMTKPTTDQIEYIELGGADMAEICRPESTGPLAQAWNWVKNGVDAVVEYFR